jgi:hypothetical protein
MIKMKKIHGIFTCLLLIIAFGVSKAQEKEISLNDLQVPSSPAFILLDAAPTSVEKPTSTKAFALSILNSINENSGLPKDYAVEFTPYWFIKHRTTAYKYWGISDKTENQLPFSSINRFAVSLALVSNSAADTLTHPKTTNISGGLRTILVKVRNQKDVKDLIEANGKIVNILRTSSVGSEVITKEINDLEDIRDTIPKDSSARKSAIMQKIDALKKTKQNHLDSLANSKELMNVEQLIFQDILARRPLFAIEGAIASNIAFNNNDFSSYHAGRNGIWFNLAYSVSCDADTAMNKKDYLNLVIMGRFLNDNYQQIITNDFATRNLLDCGGKLEFEFDRLIFSYEYIYRWDSNDKTQNSFRSSGLIKFKLNEDLYLTAAFGRNFGSGNNLISQIGINWGIGTGNEKVISK